MCLPFGGLLALDTAPPVLDVVNVQPFILHCLVTISLDEEGYVYCGALMSAAGGTYTPSAFQLKTGSGLDGHGLSAAHPNTHTHVILAGLSPGTAYDVYCYAEDLLLNGVAAAEVAASRQPGVVTASGGDYVAPTLEYVAPLEVIENTAITLFVRLSEDGTVWCVARQDRGAGTVAPSAAQVRGNLDVDAWGVEAVTAAGSYKAAVRLPGLREGSVYDAYCFAVDASGNGLDGSPALVPDPGAIGATKRAGLRTLLRLQATELRVHTSTGERRCAAEPAAWNSLLPRQAAPGSWGPPSFQAAGLVAPAAAASHGCGQLPAAPRGGGPLVAVLRRGRREGPQGSACRLSRHPPRRPPARARGGQAAGHDGGGAGPRSAHPRLGGGPRRRRGHPGEHFNFGCPSDRLCRRCPQEAPPGRLSKRRVWFEALHAALRPPGCIVGRAFRRCPTVRGTETCMQQHEPRPLQRRRPEPAAACCPVLAISFPGFCLQFASLQRQAPQAHAANTW